MTNERGRRPPRFGRIWSQNRKSSALEWDAPTAARASPERRRGRARKTAGTGRLEAAGGDDNKCGASGMFIARTSGAAGRSHAAVAGATNGAPVRAARPPPINMEIVSAGPISQFARIGLESAPAHTMAAGVG
jgi:hypothetical protein